MVAAFGTRATLSLVGGMGVTKAVSVIISRLFLALIRGGIFQIRQKCSQPLAEDLFYTRIRSV